MKTTPRQKLVAELSAIRRLQDEPPSFFNRMDHARLASEFARKSAELVSLEIKAYRQRIS